MAHADTTNVTERLRLIPPAITPVQMSDLAAGSLAHVQGRGRNEFREEIRSFLDGTSAATYTSFRRALAACLLELADKREKRTVLVPSFCSGDYPDAIEGVGLDMQRYDVDPDSLGAKPDALESLPEDTLAVIAVNVLGYSSRMDELAALCEQQDVFFVEALGYSLGAEYEGKRLGTYGDCSVLNFQQGKPIPVGGGMVVSRNRTLHFSDYDRKPVSANAAVLGGYTVCGRPAMYGLYSQVGKPLVASLGKSDRVSTHPGSKVGVDYSPPFRTMSNFQGAIGSRIFDRLSDHRRKRARNARYYAAALAGTEGLRQIQPVDGLGNHQYVRYPLLFESSHLRDTVQEELAAVNIEATMLYDWPKIDPDTYPGGALLQKRILTLPTHPYIHRSDRERTVQTICDVLRTQIKN